MSNVIITKTGINYKMKVEYMASQLLTHVVIGVALNLAMKIS
jgi:hypothetical protein